MRARVCSAHSSIRDHWALSVIDYNRSEDLIPISVPNKRSSSKDVEIDTPVDKKSRFCCKGGAGGRRQRRVELFRSCYRV
ncbi:hypothetical protein TNCV_3295381 [Trichonephila clavipes]|uniref:Uncharacterized protein n=1 Tax=Trichonephila clavipes TaxID=2585209 RepID=A0A8X6VT27_TRICX|nr:hypothetical protein TNCV_3295381 [Trichonephila clavipes]